MTSKAIVTDMTHMPNTDEVQKRKSKADSVWDEVNQRYDQAYSSDSICDYLGLLDEQLDSVIDRQVKALAVMEIATLRALGEGALSTKDHMATEQAIYHLKIFTHQLEVLESFMRRHVYELAELPDPVGEAVMTNAIEYYRHRAEFALYNRKLAEPFLPRGAYPFDFNDWQVGRPRESVDQPV